MQIEDLKEYPLLYDLARREYESQTGQYHPGANVMDFSWDQTDEGHEFWSHINRGRFDTAMDINPELFKKDNKNLVVQNNGLFN